jgi:asparagine synthetase A
MNKIPQNYLSKLSLRETQEAQQYIKNNIIDILSNKLNISIVRSPIYTTINQTSDLKRLQDSRVINFDSTNDDEIYYLYTNYKFFLVNTLSRLEIKNNNGIASFVNYVSRDQEISNIKSMEKNELQIEYRFDNPEVTSQKMVELAQETFSSLKQILSGLKKRFNSLLIELPDEMDLVDFDKVKKQKTKINIDSLKTELANIHGIYLLSDFNTEQNDLIEGREMKLSIEAYSPHADSSYSIATVANRITPSDITKIANTTEQITEEYMFAKERLIDQELRSINITIDLDALSMLLLEKAHILELQSGNFIEDVEKLLENKKIKHL